MKEKIRPLSGRVLVNEIVAGAQEKKAEDIVLLQFPEGGISDWFVVCGGDNPHHNRAIVNSVVTRLKEKHTPPWQVEGVEESRWVLVDYADVVLHVMLPEVREYYRLEELWNECTVTRIPSVYVSENDDKERFSGF